MGEEEYDMNKNGVVILGATGGVGTVVTYKCIEAELGRIICASRNEKKFEALSKKLEKPVEFYAVDASDVNQLVKMLGKLKPELLLNVGEPYWNLNCMEACLKTGVNYEDTACWEPFDEARFRHAEQWAFHRDYKKAGLMALIGCGFDPGVSNAWVAYAFKHYFKEIHRVQIWDCNGGDHGKVFASNFNLAINLRELLGAIRFWLNGGWKYSEPLISEKAVHYPYDFEEIGKRMLYLLYHEELESLAKNFPQIKEMSFWMTFGEQYLRCLRAFYELGLTSIKKIKLGKHRVSPLEFLQAIVPDAGLIVKHEDLLGQIGMLSTIPIVIDAREISPLEYLQKVLPDPSTLGEGYSGKTNISALFEGVGYDGKPLRYRILQIKDHADCNREVGAQAVSYTTGVPAMVGAHLMRKKIWFKPGVYNVEEFDPDDFLGSVSFYGLPMSEQFDDEVPPMFIPA